MLDLHLEGFLSILKFYMGEFSRGLNQGEGAYWKICYFTSILEYAMYNISLSIKSINQPLINRNTYNIYHFPFAANFFNNEKYFNCYDWHTVDFMLPSGSLFKYCLVLSFSVEAYSRAGGLLQRMDFDIRAFSREGAKSRSHSSLI